MSGHTPRHGNMSLTLTLLLLGAGGLLTGCDSSRAWQPDRPQVTAETSPARMKAAAALSVFTATPQRAADPYARAVECAAAIGWLNSKIGDSALVSRKDLQVVHDAARMFESQLLNLSEAGGKTRRETAIDVRRAQDNFAENPSEAGRSAIGCIGQLGKDNQTPRG